MTNHFVVIDNPLGKIRINWNSPKITALIFDSSDEEICSSDPTIDVVVIPMLLNKWSKIFYAVTVVNAVVIFV